MKYVDYIYNCCLIIWLPLITCQEKTYDEIYKLKNNYIPNYLTDHNLYAKNDGKNKTGNTPFAFGSTHHPETSLEKQSINKVGDLQTQPYNLIEQKHNSVNKSDVLTSMMSTFHIKDPPVHVNIHHGHNQILKKQLYNPSDQPTSLANTQVAQERSSYLSYDPENSVPIQHVQVPESSYHSQSLYPQHNYQQNYNYGNGYGTDGTGSKDSVLKEKQEDDTTFEDYEKDKYFYHKSKIATKAAYWVIAVHFLVIAANFAYASVLATFTGSTDPPRGERKKRETPGEVSGREATFDEAFSCMMKFMCEYDQSQDFVDLGTMVSKPMIEERQDFVVNRRSDSDAKKRKKWRQMKQRDFRRRRRRRPRREISQKRDCTKIYKACAIDFSLFFKLTNFLG